MNKPNFLSGYYSDCVVRIDRKDVCNFLKYERQQLKGKIEIRKNDYDVRYYLPSGRILMRMQVKNIKRAKQLLKGL